MQRQVPPFTLTALTLVTLTLLTLTLGACRRGVQVVAITTDGSTPSLDASDALDPFPLHAGPCSASGWCWAYPQPTGVTLHALWAASPTDVYAAGDAGTLLHYDGTSWRALYAGRQPENWYRIYGIWGSSATNIWAVAGEGALLHFDGNDWSHAPSLAPTLQAIWGTSASNVFAAGSGILHFDGERWQPSPLDDDLTEAFEAGFSVTENVAFAVGRGGLVARYDGSRWSRVQTPDDMGNLSAVWGTSETNVYVGGTGLTLWRFDGTRWENVSDRTNTINAIWGRSASEIYIAQADGVFRFDGQAFAPLFENAGAETLVGDGADGIFAVGQAGRIFQGDASGLTLIHGSVQGLEAVWARSASEIYIGGYNHVWRLRKAGARGYTLESFFNVMFSAKALCGQEPDVLHALSGSYLYTSRGGAAPTRTTLPHRGEDLWCSSSHVFSGGQMPTAANRGALHRFDGSAWETVCEDASSFVEKIWGSSATDVYATLWNSRYVLHYDGVGCQELDTGASSIVDVWGTSATNVTLLSWTGAVSHFEGAAWTRSMIFSEGPLEGLAGEEDLVAFGRYGLIYRWVGGQWIEESTPASRLKAAWVKDGIGLALSHTGVLIHR
ncbi:MAG: hypothetical protein JRH20_06590 [Deltaproteobacteria bacterium]|nr:hypothetical protein [Deltaproteobacteria bacterium]